MTQALYLEIFQNYFPVPTTSNHKASSFTINVHLVCTVVMSSAGKIVKTAILLGVFIPCQVPST